MYSYPKFLITTGDNPCMTAVNRGIEAATEDQLKPNSSNCGTQVQASPSEYTLSTLYAEYASTR